VKGKHSKSQGRQTHAARLGTTAGGTPPQNPLACKLPKVIVARLPSPLVTGVVPNAFVLCSTTVQRGREKERAFQVFATAW